MDIIQNEISIRDKFLQYPEIKEIDANLINEIKESSGLDKEWIITEKIRGMHISLIADSNQVKIANGFGICHNSLFNYLICDTVLGYFDKIKHYCSDNKITMQLYGTFFGGYYNNNFSVVEHVPMDRLISYSMHHHWFVHDIRINSEFVSWEKVVELTTLFDIPHVPILRRTNLIGITKISPEKYLSVISYLLHKFTIENNYVEGFVIRNIDTEKTQRGDRMIFKNIRKIMRKIGKRSSSTNVDTKGIDMSLNNFVEICDKYITNQRFSSIFNTIGNPKSQKDLGLYLSTYCKNLYLEMKKENIEPKYIKTIQKISVYRIKNEFYKILADACIDVIEKRRFQEECKKGFDMYIDEYGNAVMDSFKPEEDNKDKNKNVVNNLETNNQQTAVISTSSNNNNSNNTAATKEYVNQAANSYYYGGRYDDEYEDYSPTYYKPEPDTTINFIACNDVDEKDLLVPSYKEKKAPGFGFYTIEETVIKSDEVKIIRSGWRCKIEEGYIVYFEARSSLDANKDIYVLTKPNIVTSDYEDELRFVIWNNSKETITIPKNTMIVYGILCKTEKVYIDVIKEENIKIIDDADLL